MEKPMCATTVHYSDNVPVLVVATLTLPYHDWYTLSNSDVFRKVMGGTAQENENESTLKDMNTLHIENGRVYVNGTEITCVEFLNIKQEDSANCGFPLVELKFLAKDIASLKTEF